MASAKRALPQSWNRYAYVLNNPLKYVDPTGLEWLQRTEGGKTTYCYRNANEPCRKFKTKYNGEILENPSINGSELGYAIRLTDRNGKGDIERVVAVDVEGFGRAWLDPKDAEAIYQVTGGLMCSASAGLACPSAGSPIADNVTAAADAVQMAFLIKTLIASGVSLAVLATIVKKNPDDVAKLAEKELAKGCYQNGDCKVFADNLLKEMEKNGIKGELRQLSSPTNMPIMKAGQETAAEAVAFRGLHHYGVQVGDNIYEMYKTGGVPVSKWSSMYTTAGPGGSVIPTVLVSVPK